VPLITVGGFMFDDETYKKTCDLLNHSKQRGQAIELLNYASDILRKHKKTKKEDELHELQRVVDRAVGFLLDTPLKIVKHQYQRTIQQQCSIDIEASFFPVLIRWLAENNYHDDAIGAVGMLSHHLNELCGWGLCRELVRYCFDEKCESVKGWVKTADECAENRHDARIKINVLEKFKKENDITSTYIKNK